MTERAFVLGGGCFWCLDAAYRQVHGVSDVVSGYAGGIIPDPSYELVCTGRTGHAEVVQVVFDDAEVPAEVILDMFFTMHDPRQKDRQGNDIGTQYRSIMLYEGQEERELFEAALERADEHWGGGVVTQIEPLTEFYPAEDYHQNYFAKNPANAYCQAVAVPKMLKVRANFAPFVEAPGARRD